MEPKEYFFSQSPIQKRYEAMKLFFAQEGSAEEVAGQFGYSLSTVYTLTKKFRKELRENPSTDPFFITPKKGRPFKDDSKSLAGLIISLRKKNLSVPDIKSIIDSIPEFEVSESYIDYLLKQEGFLRLPRRTQTERTTRILPEKITADKSKKLALGPDHFSSSDIGVLCFLPIIKKYGLDRLIKQSLYPYTRTIGRLSSIMSFLALKLTNIRRYTKDDLWCMDRGPGLFAGLNVLPKAAWYSSYSSRVTRNMNMNFLKEMHKIWLKEGLLGDTVNLDFTSIPYWGDDAHLENNWSGKRNKALSSMLAILAQDSDSGIIDYGDTDVKHKNQNQVVLEFIDFYKSGEPRGSSLKYLVFDSKFTTYENLSKLDDANIKFLTIRRRGKSIIKGINEIPASDWKKVRVECAGNKKRTLKVNDSRVFMKGYGRNIRQVAITGHGKIKPALIITNDFERKTETIIRKYTRRWLVEKGISEQIEFFHLNKVSSSMVIKVDFDLTMSIAAHNIVRLLARELERYTNKSDQSIYEEFIKNSGDVGISEHKITVHLKKKRNLPELLTMLENYSNQVYPMFGNRIIEFLGSSTT